MSGDVSRFEQEKSGEDVGIACDKNKSSQKCVGIACNKEFFEQFRSRIEQILTKNEAKIRSKMIQNQIEMRLILDHFERILTE